MSRANPCVMPQTGILMNQLPVQARLRLEHAGRWVVWSDDFTRVLAVADDPEAVREAARQAGATQAVCEWIPPVPIRPLGQGK